MTVETADLQEREFAEQAQAMLARHIAKKFEDSAERRLAVWVDAIRQQESVDIVLPKPCALPITLKDCGR